MLIASLVFAPVAQAAEICVLVSPGKRNDRAAVAAAKVLPGASVVEAKQTENCEAAIAVGSAAWKSAASLKVPVVGVLVPHVQLEESSYAVSFEPDPGTVMGLLKKLSSRAVRIGLVYDPKKTGGLVKLAEQMARARGLELVALAATSTREAVRAFARFEKELSIDALWILPDPTTTTRETAYYALELAQWRRIPVIGPSRWYVASGALFALTPDIDHHGALAAQLMARVLGDEQPPSLLYASSDQLILNARTASRLGLRLPEDVIDSAAEIIR